MSSFIYSHLIIRNDVIGLTDSMKERELGSEEERGVLNGSERLKSVNMPHLALSCWKKSTTDSACSALRDVFAMISSTVAREI